MTACPRPGGTSSSLATDSERHQLWRDEVSPACDVRSDDYGYARMDVRWAGSRLSVLAVASTLIVVAACGSSPGTDSRSSAQSSASTVTTAPSSDQIALAEQLQSRLERLGIDTDLGAAKRAEQVAFTAEHQGGGAVLLCTDAPDWKTIATGSVTDDPIIEGDERSFHVRILLAEARTYCPARLTELADALKQLPGVADLPYDSYLKALED